MQLSARINHVFCKCGVTSYFELVCVPLCSNAVICIGIWIIGLPGRNKNVQENVQIPRIAREMKLMNKISQRHFKSTK